MTLNVSEQAQPQVSKALSGTKKAPLFRWNGIQDDEDAPLQEAFYAKCLDGIAIFGRCACKFSPLVRSWFERSPYSGVRGILYQRRIVSYRIDLRQAHPLYPQVKAAYETQEAYSNSIVEDAEEWKHDTGKEVAA
ncbi:hypothetical protein [Xylella fastidiosa]|uniref:hypothetical protein n=1 Tax=Xylella fastidiosa TaxID=2371 RepID=UPI000FFF3269|nr:hypothetical protein [Xylella fastidiosa]RWA36756.1 hypothetical protein XfCFBP8078_11470 [Xylella fastidiosa subsp. multiplex]